MKKKKGYRVGSKFIENGKVYRVFKIEKREIEGKEERIICYRPYYKNSTNNGLVCSIPESNIKKHTNIRRPVSKKILRKIFRYLSRKSKGIEALDIAEAKATLKENNIYRTARLLKRCLKEKSQKEVNFTKAKKDILGSAIDSMTEEAAFVLKIPLDKAEDKITGQLVSN